MRHSDIIVVGSGLSGLTAALTAAKAGKTVTVLSKGAGVLSVGGGAIDFLGKVAGETVGGDPYDFVDKLGAAHPYRIAGKDSIKEAFAELTAAAQENGLIITCAPDGANKKAVTVMGTLRPTYLTTESMDATPLFSAKKVLVAGIDFLKDFQPQLAIRQMKEYAALSDIEFRYAMFGCPDVYKNTTLNCLNFARYADKPEGFSWLLSELKKAKGDADLILIPPVCGAAAHNEIYTKLKKEGLNIVEMVSIPPGVGGMRLRTALYSAMKNLPVRFADCCEVTYAHVENGKCAYLESDFSGVKTKYYADKFIIATGGILGGGIITKPASMREAIFGIDIPSPARVEDWTQKDVFADHMYVKKGVSVSPSFKATDGSGREIFDNVFFAGRTLAGYDFAKEKSGYGVAAVTGYCAARQALK